MAAIIEKHEASIEDAKKFLENNASEFSDGILLLENENGWNYRLLSNGHIGKYAAYEEGKVQYWQMGIGEFHKKLGTDNLMNAVKIVEGALKRK